MPSLRHGALKQFSNRYEPRRYKDTKANLDFLRAFVSSWFPHLSDDALDAVFHERHVEIEQEAETFVCQFQVSNQLRGVHWMN